MYLLPKCLLLDEWNKKIPHPYEEQTICSYGCGGHFGFQKEHFRMMIRPYERRHTKN